MLRAFYDSFCAYSHFMNFSSRYCILGSPKQSRWEILEQNRLPLERFWWERSKNPQLGWVMYNLPSQLPGSGATRLLGSPQSGWPPSLAPSASQSSALGLQGRRAAPLPQPGSCLGAPGSAGTAGARLWQPPGLRACPAPRLLCCTGFPAGRQRGARLPAGPIPRQPGNLRSLGQHFVFQKEIMYVGKSNTWEAGERIFSMLPALSRSPRGLPGRAGRVPLCKFWFHFAHKRSTLRGWCCHSPAPCRVSLTSSTEKPHSIPAALEKLTILKIVHNIWEVLVWCAKNADSF